MTHVMAFSTSEPQDFALYDRGVAIDGTGWFIGIEWQNQPLNPPQVAWLSQAAGTVRVTGCELMPEGQYKFRFTLTGLGGASKGYAPNGQFPDTWHVVR